MPHTTRRIDRATRALAAYELDAFPGKPSLLQRDTFYTEALLAALVCDLEHYANHHGINFSAVIGTGRALNAGEVTDDAPYKVGDQARLTRQHDHCGTIIGWQTTGPDAETSFLVSVPGIPHVYAEPAARLAPPRSRRQRRSWAPSTTPNRPNSSTPASPPGPRTHQKQPGRRSNTTGNGSWPH